MKKIDKNKFIAYMITLGTFMIACIVIIIYKSNTDVTKGWYVKITNEYINLRTETNTYGKPSGKVYMGEIYKALAIKEDDTYIWYKIDYKGKEYWIANPRATAYLKDYNDPNDIQKPTLKFYDEVYYTKSIDTINYDHLEITDDSTDYEITHKVFKADDGVYFITYTVTDKAGHSVSKTQKIEFEIEPEF